MQHLLGIQGLSREDLYAYLHNAHNFVEVSRRDIKKVPTLRGKTVINLFLENSTRTRTSFEIAGKRMSADTINISGTGSSTAKGESLLDTARNLQAMRPDVLVVRHAHSGTPQFLARFLKNTAVVNAGDGMHEHPTQALLDLLSIRQWREEKGLDSSLTGLKVAIVGDIRHSRVARSNILAHSLLGNTVHLVGPATLVPQFFAGSTGYGENVRVFHDLATGISGCDVIIVLRMQLERMQEHFVSSLEEYTNEYFVSSTLVHEHAPDAVLLHPGPVNRGVEVESRLIDGERSLMTRQVENGVAVRMAVLFALANREVSEEEQ